MKQCWPEGALRAYLDGELPPQAMESVTAHLSECAACERLRVELAARAGHVAGLIGTLAEAVARTPRRQAAARSAGSWGWTAAAVALAAGLAIATVLVPKPGAPKPAPVAVIETAPPAAEAVPPAPALAPERVPVPARAAVARKSRRLSALPEPFLALDNEPIESGIVMRVTVPGSTPADIVFSPDGRARAIRLVNGTKQDR